jgi:hypothetical protein
LPERQETLPVLVLAGSAAAELRLPRRTLKSRYSSPLLLIPEVDVIKLPSGLRAGPLVIKAASPAKYEASRLRTLEASRRWRRRRIWRTLWTGCGVLDKSRR